MGRLRKVLQMVKVSLSMDMERFAATARFDAPLVVGSSYPWYRIHIRTYHGKVATAQVAEVL